MSELNGRHPARDAAAVAEVLDRVRQNAVRLLAEVPRCATVVRVRIGDVSVEVECAQHTTQPTAQPTAQDAVPGSPAETAPSDPESTVEPAGAEYLTAPTVGAFHRAPAPGAQPFVVEGGVVSGGQQVGILEAMKLMIPVLAERPGRIAAILKQDGDRVEYGERLFRLVPD